jgi:hypothetical protein
VVRASIGDDEGHGATRPDEWGYLMPLLIVPPCAVGEAEEEKM